MVEADQLWLTKAAIARYATYRSHTSKKGDKDEVPGEFISDSILASESLLGSFDRHVGMYTRVFVG